MHMMQVQLQSMYESYYAADPSTHTPPIPTVNLRLSHEPQRKKELCSQATETTSGERGAAKAALLDAVFALEKALAPEHPIRQMVDAGSSNWMGRYIIKREYSEGAHHIHALTLPELSPSSTSANATQMHYGTRAADTAPSALADQWNASSPESSSNQSYTLGDLPRQLSALVTESKAAILHPGLSITAAASREVDAALQPLGAQSCDIDPGSHTCHNPNLAAHDTADVLNHSSGVGAAENGRWAYTGMQLPAQLDSLLEETADKLLRHSCGEGWLVQPRIANMSGLEYRVYLLGGASAVSALSGTMLFLQPCYPLPMHDYHATQSAEGSMATVTCNALLLALVGGVTVVSNLCIMLGCKDPQLCMTSAIYLLLAYVDGFASSIPMMNCKVVFSTSLYCQHVGKLFSQPVAAFQLHPNCYLHKVMGCMRFALHYGYLLASS